MRVHEADMQQEYSSNNSSSSSYSSSQMPPANGRATFDLLYAASATSVIGPGAPPDETDDITDILHVGLLGGLGE